VRKRIEGEWPSLEVRIESLNYVGNLLLEEVERFHDKRSVLERYLAGDLESHHHGSEYCAITTTLVRGNGGGDKVPMLVGIGEVADFPGPLITETRLQPLNRCLVRGGELVKPHFAEFFVGRSRTWEVIIPTLFMVFNREFRSIARLSSIQIEQLVDEIVEGGPEIVDRLPDENGNDWGSFDTLRSAADKTGPGNHRADCALRRGDGSNLTLKACDMLFCPTYSRASLIKGWLNAIGVHMTKNRDELDETKRLMGALVRMKPKPHDEMKVGKGTKAKRQSRPKKARAK
jgi:hypothetical protein